jgi:hypothetical protein
VETDETVFQVLDQLLRAYNGHDFEAWRPLIGADFVGIDHRPGSLGTYALDDFIAFTEGLFAQVRTQHLEAQFVEMRGNVGLFRTVETAETLDGVEISFETLMIIAIVDGKVRRQEFFAPEAEADARARFDELSAR